MRGRTVLEGVHQEAEFVLRVFVGQAEKMEHLVLKFGIVDTDAAAAKFVAIDNHVVGRGANFARCRFEFVDVIGIWRRERVVHSVIALRLVVPLKQREIDNPEARELLRVAQSET